MGVDPGNRENREEQQRRELEEIRNSFRQIGIRMGSLFEPAQESGNGTAEAEPEPEAEAEVEASEPQEPELRELVPQQPVPRGAERHQPDAPALRSRSRTPTWVLPAVIGLICLLVGGGVGYLLHRPAEANLTPAAPTVITRTILRDKPVVPPECLEAARRADETMDMLVRNVRDRRLSLALKAYTVASQACRREASP